MVVCELNKHLHEMRSLAFMSILFKSSGGDSVVSRLKAGIIHRLPAHAYCSLTLLSMAIGIAPGQVPLQCSYIVLIQVQEENFDWGGGGGGGEFSNTSYIVQSNLRTTTFIGGDPLGPC